MVADFVTGRWSAELEDLFLRVSGRFGRVEVRRRMRDYVRGLLGPVGRKNSWQPAEYAGHNGPCGRKLCCREADGIPTNSGTTCRSTWPSGSAPRTES
jgi:hypothetical protein